VPGDLLQSYADLLAGYGRANVTGARGSAEGVADLIGDALALLDVDELQVAAQAVDGAPWADLGSGGGVPGIPLALALPDVRFTLIEAVGKKCAFLREAVALLGLGTRVEVACARSEELTAVGAPARETFGVVLAKAVGPLSVVVELAAPALRPGGLLLVSKTAAAADGEAAAAAAAGAACGLARGRTVALTRSPLPGSVCVVFEKTAPTAPRFPRRPGMAAKRPLA
jgi:16S rRNA (guanine527-N7)-methyltransferase